MIKKTIKKIIRYCQSPFVIGDYYKFKKNNQRFTLLFRDIYPCVFDKTIKTGFDAHYIYHTAWAARKVKEISPIRHIDISSSLYFSSIISAFVSVDFYDYRPPNLKLSNLRVAHTDLNKLHFQDSSLESVSCMHTVEHVGLGRYGDSIDPEGDLKSIFELKRVLKSGGSLLFVVPVGHPKIEFNAHRIYAYEQIISYFDGFLLKEFSLVDDNGIFIENADSNLVKNQKYGCGCFWFIKK